MAAEERRSKGWSNILIYVFDIVNECMKWYKTQCDARLEIWTIGRGDLGKYIGIERHYSPRIRWPQKKATEKCLSCQSLFARVEVLHEVEG